MRRNKLLIILILTMLFIVGCSRNESSSPSNNVSDTQANTNIGVIEDKMIGVFQFTNASLIWKDNKSILEVTITNTSDEVKTLSIDTIEFYEEETLIASVPGLTNITVKAHEATIIDVTHYENLIKATKVEYNINK